MTEHDHPVVCKTAAKVQPGSDDTDAPNGSFEVILSTSDEDRDGEILDPFALDPLPEHITFDVDHGMSVLTTVGSGVPEYTADGKQIRVKGTYASTDLAQETRALVNEGHIRTTSIAFLRKSVAKDKASRPHVTKGELLNGAFTPIPANTGAVVLSSKAAAALKAGARNSAADAERLQTAHDALVDAGAACEGMVGGKSFRPRAAAKSIVGSVEALQDRVCDALSDAYGSGRGWWGWLRGVIPNDARDGGTVVFNSSKLCDPLLECWDSHTYRQTYTDDGSVVTLTGTAEEVDIFEIVTPDADADRETDTTLPTGKAAATDGSTTEDEIALRARALSIRAEAAAALGE
jgi:hypothetical protein